MRIHLGLIIDRLQSSLWVWPGLASLVAIGMGFGLPWLDSQAEVREGAWFVFGGGAESARELLSTIISSMITFTGVVFSITVLVLQLASSQFSPRVIRTFLHEPVTKIAMAAFVGTFVFAMVVLTRVRSAPDEVVPRLSVWIAVMLVLLSTAIFLAYIERMAHSVRAITILSKVAAETRAAIDRTFPERPTQAPQRAAERPSRPPDGVVTLEDAPGIVAAVDREDVVTLAAKHAAFIEMVPRVGEFVPTGSTLYRVWGDVRALKGALRQAMSFAPERTPYQDAAFGLRQLVDVALRALSPSLNDPTTAVQALDYLHDLVRRITQRGLPSEAQLDEGGVLRFVVPEPSYAELVALAFDEISLAGHHSLQLADRLRAALADCMSVAPPERVAVLEAKLKRLDSLLARLERSHEAQC
jgi:uncharacterized membrane protein